MAEYVWIRPQSALLWLWKPFSEHLEQRTGLRPLFLLKSKEQEHFFEKQFDQEFRAERVIRPNLYRHIPESDLHARRDSIVRRATEIEGTYDISLMRSLILGDRRFGHALSPGGAGHPKDRVARNASQLRALDACNETFDFHEDLFRKYPPRLCIGYAGGGGMYGKPITLMFRKQNLDFRGLTLAKIGDLYFWAEDEYDDSSRLDAFVREKMSQASDAALVLPEDPPTYSWAGKDMVSRFRKGMSWPNLAKRIGYQIAARAYGRLRGYRRATDGYYLSEIIKMFVRMGRHWRLLERLSIKDFSLLPAPKIVYFPLQVEPEETITIQSPEFSNPLAAVYEVALELPADATLVVKEHIWQVGRRPDSYYQALLAIPNVALAHPDVSSIDLIKASSLVCTINSSAANEAAILGKPVLRFGRHGSVRHVPHVRTLTSLDQLPVIRQILSEDPASGIQERLRHGQLYKEALEEHCVNLADLKLPRRTAAPSEGEMTILSDSLLATLSAPETSAEKLTVQETS